jgi:hypothetical protein
MGGANDYNLFQVQITKFDAVQTETWFGLFGVVFRWRSYLTHDVEFSVHFHVAQHEEKAPDVTCLRLLF